MNVTRGRPGPQPKIFSGGTRYARAVTRALRAYATWRMSCAAWDESLVVVRGNPIGSHKTAGERRSIADRRFSGRRSDRTAAHRELWFDESPP